MTKTSPATITGLLAIAGLLAACGQAEEKPGEVETFAAISEDETISLLGTEPFWSMAIVEDTLTYMSPDNLEGVSTDVTRFTGNNGLGISGELEGEALQIAITPGDCSDAMSERNYPYTVTVTWGERQLNGCGYTDKQPFTGEIAP